MSAYARTSALTTVEGTAGTAANLFGEPASRTSALAGDAPALPALPALASPSITTRKSTTASPASALVTAPSASAARRGSLSRAILLRGGGAFVSGCGSRGAGAARVGPVGG